jgi:hypothetical protein
MAATSIEAATGRAGEGRDHRRAQSFGNCVPLSAWRAYGLVKKNLAGAAQILEPVYNQFSEGIDTTDVQVAKRLLDGIR